ncbi:MAG: disulfide bond formation protein B [Beijerinckiaceae bacterium]
MAMPQYTGRAKAAWFVFLVAFATIAGAWIFEWLGYAPCKLCLQQRYAYYAALPLALLATWLAVKRSSVAAALLALVALIFVGSALFGAWHAGIEWGYWAGPADCAPARPTALGAGGGLLQQMQTTRVISCTEPALRIFGLSLAGWNAVISSALAALALHGAFRARA